MRHAGRRIALMCIDPAEDEGVLSLNYSTRKLIAALQSAPAIEGLDVHLVESCSKHPEEFLQRLEEIEPDIVGAAAYVWSLPTFAQVTREWKRRRPHCTVIYGGPSARLRMLRHAPFADAPEHVDAFVDGDGEQILREIVCLADRSRESLSTIPGLMVSTGSGWRLSGERGQSIDLSSFESPYVMGLLDRQETGLLETYRGCPFTCSFCQWGDAKKLERTFSAEYIAGDLNALAGLDAKGAALVDAGLNLNPLAFRNLAQAEKEVGFFRERNFYCEVYPSKLTREHIDFLDGVQADRISVGLQSFDPDVLDVIQRNFEEENFRRVVHTLAGIANKVTVEIILGLPGDKPSSFLNTLDRVMDLPCETRVFHCLVLPDALMDRAPADADMVYDSSTLQMKSCRGWSEAELAKMGERLDRRAEELGGVAMRDWWEFQGASPDAGRSQQGAEPVVVAADQLAPETEGEIAERVRGATAGAWDVDGSKRSEGSLCVSLSTPDGPLLIDIKRSVENGMNYRSVAGIDYSYRNVNGGPSRKSLRYLDRVIESLSSLVTPQMIDD